MSQAAMNALMVSIRERITHPDVRAKHDAVDAALWAGGTPPISDLAAVVVRMLGNVVLMTPAPKRLDVVTAIGVMAVELAQYIEQQDAAAGAGST